MNFSFTSFYGYDTVGQTKIMSSFCDIFRLHLSGNFRSDLRVRISNSVWFNFAS